MGVTVPTRHAGRRTLHAVGRSLGRVWLLVALLVAWEVLARARPTVFLPPLSQIGQAFADGWLSSDIGSGFLSDQARTDISTSLGRLLVGWGAAAVIGVAAGVVYGRIRAVERMYSPTVRFFSALPNTALLPIAVQVFGVASGMNVFLIFIGTVWLILINAADGVRGVDAMWLRSARSMRISGFPLYRWVILPAAMPQILTGLRVSLGIGLILMILSELYATTSGIGYQITAAQQSFLYKQMWAALLVVSAIGVILNLVFAAIERRVIRWKHRAGLADL